MMEVESVGGEGAGEKRQWGGEMQDGVEAEEEAGEVGERKKWDGEQGRWVDGQLDGESIGMNITEG